MGVCPIEPTLVFLSFLFFSFIFCFFLIFFFSSCSVFFFFYSPKYALFSIPLYRARQRPFYSACRDHGFTILPLNRLCLVWAYLPTTRGVCHSPLPDRGRFQFSPCRSTSFLPRYKCFLSLLSEHAPTVPPQTCLFWVVCHPSRTYLPKEAWAGAVNRFFPLPPPPNHTPFTSYLWPMAPPCPILAGYRLVVPGPCACFPFKFVQESACCSCVCRDLETLRLHFSWPFMWAFLWFFAPFRS